MFDSAYTDHDIIDATPFGRDPMKELADACAKHDMLLGCYYSVWYLHHPHYSKEPGKPDYAKYHQYMLDQSEELLTNYGPIVTVSKLKGKQSPLAAGFHTESLGKVQLNKPGTYQLTVKAVEIDNTAKEYDHGIMLLREVILAKPR